MEVDFASFPYYPSLQCGFAEQHAYRQLSMSDKEALLPIFELGQRTYDDYNFVGPLQEIETSIETRPFILDLSKEPCPKPFVPAGKKLSEAENARLEAQTTIQQSYNSELAKLLDSADGFKNWRQLAAAYPKCIPVLQFSDAATQSKSILRQGALLARQGSIAIRITAETDEAIYPVIAQLISTLDTAASLLMIADCGQRRSLIAERAEFARQAIAKIQSEVDVLQWPELRAVCLSNSFPNAQHDGLKQIENLDQELWEQASENFPFFYGDYGAVFRRRNKSMYIPAEWRAAVTYPVDGGWLIYRDPNARDPQGWITGSKEIQEHDAFNFLDAWGGDVVAKAAEGDLRENKSARYWYAVKTNLHLHQQLHFAGPTADYEE
jgi:TusA-related sulfurtransferase